MVNKNIISSLNSLQIDYIFNSLKAEFNLITPVDFWGGFLSERQRKLIYLLETYNLPARLAGRGVEIAGTLYHWPDIARAARARAREVKQYKRQHRLK